MRFNPASVFIPTRYQQFKGQQMLEARRVQEERAQQALEELQQRAAEDAHIISRIERSGHPTTAALHPKKQQLKRTRRKKKARRGSR